MRVLLTRPTVRPLALTLAVTLGVAAGVVGATQAAQAGTCRWNYNVYGAGAYFTYDSGSTLHGFWTSRLIYTSCEVVTLDFEGMQNVYTGNNYDGMCVSATAKVLRSSWIKWGQTRSVCEPNSVTLFNGLRPIGSRFVVIIRAYSIYQGANVRPDAAVRA